MASDLTPERTALASGNSGRAVWLTEESPAPRLLLLREVREIEGLTFQPLATVAIEVDFPALVEQYRRGMAQTGTPLRCGVYRAGICLYASDETVRTLPEGADGYTRMKLDGQDVLCVRYTAADGMRYAALTDYSGIHTTLFFSFTLTIVVILASMLLAIFISVVLMDSILGHLQILIGKLDAFAASGKPVAETASPYHGRKDEIGVLHGHFDRMTRAADRLRRDKEEQQRLLQEKQMQQLRAQVRPHFLYNTLESIYCLAQNAEDERIAVMTDALGKMLRASLNDTRDIVTVGEDLQITREYLRIQLIRYGARLRVEYAVAENVLPCAIPAMTIQPLVENAIHHAAEEMLETCVIRICGHRTASGMDILVEDNGPGLDEDILRKLETGEVQPEGMGIGMRNIDSRIHYAFPGPYGLTVHRANGRTQIIAHLPAATREP